jgi:hypothetical protein
MSYEEIGTQKHQQVSNKTGHTHSSYVHLKMANKEVTPKYMNPCADPLNQHWDEVLLETVQVLHLCIVKT